MSTGGLVMLDIGNTLVTGPAQGPARRIATALGLDDAARRALHMALMTTDFADAAQVAGFIESHCGAPAERSLAVVREVWDAQELEVRPVDGALAVVAALHERGIPMALVSNIWAPYFAGFWRSFGTLVAAAIPPAQWLLSYRLGAMKPSPQPFRAALAAGDVAPERAVMIGDSYDKDIAPAAALGINTIWVTADPPDQEQDTVTPTIASIADLDIDRLAQLGPGR